MHEEKIFKEEEERYCFRNYWGGEKGYVGKHSANANKKMYERELIFAYVVADDDSTIKVNIHKHHTKLMENTQCLCNQGQMKGSRRMLGNFN